MPFGTRRVSNYNFRADIQVDVLLAEVNAGLVSWPRRLLAIHDVQSFAHPMSIPLVETDMEDEAEAGAALAAEAGGAAPSSA